ncbi:hypothetical protein IJ750_02920 [bacterium]|nr:hypothetical protein [bacterium]
MVQAIDKILNKPVYNAVNINIKKPEVNAKQNGEMSVNNDSGIYNAVKINIDNPAVNAEPKKVYDYPKAENVVTYNNANLQPIALPEGMPVGDAYKTSEELTNDINEPEVPAPNYTTTEAEKGIDETENITKTPDNEDQVAFHGAEQAKKKPEIIPSEEIKPDIDISATLSNLKSDNYDTQAVEIAKIAYLTETNPEAAKPYIVIDVFKGLIDVVKKDSSSLQGPSEKQNEIRQKLIADIVAVQNKKPLPYKLTKEEQQLAVSLSPMEMAERNKEYALVTISSLAKNYVNQVQKETGNVVPLTDVPGISDMVDCIRYSKNPDVKITALEALAHIYKPEYKEEMTAIFKVAQKDKHPAVAKSAEIILTKISQQ